MGGDTKTAATIYVLHDGELPKLKINMKTVMTRILALFVIALIVVDLALSVTSRKMKQRFKRPKNVP